MPDITRRNFLQGVAAGGAALGLAPILAASTGDTAQAATAVAAAAAQPKRGGTLTAGLTGGSVKDTLDPHSFFSNIDGARCDALFDSLVQRTPDGKSLINVLVDELTPSRDLRSWTIRLKHGLEFSNGKSVSAKDVAYTFQRITNPKAPLNGAAPLSLLNAQDVKILDKRTLRIGTHGPFGSFPTQISTASCAIVPVGFDPKKPVGTGAFKVQSFTPGQQSVFVRNPNYFQSGRPYLDEFTVVDLSTDESGYNGVSTGQLDIYGNALLSLANEAKSNSNLRIFASKPSQIFPFTMRVDQKPFSDPRVRKAFRLLVDRKQILENVFSGYGVVGNDLWGFADANFPDWKIEQDIPQAKSLLKQAGYGDSVVTLVSADIGPGAQALAQAYVQQAATAGVKIKLDNAAYAVYENGYSKWTFSQDFYGANPYLQIASLSFLKGGVWNETHWNDPEYTKLYNEANATVDPKKLTDIKLKMWKINFDRGAYIIPVYTNVVDIMTPHIHGFVPSVNGGGLYYGVESLWKA